MKRRRLGRTGLSVSEVGLGGGGIGAVYGETTAEESRRAVERALELGVDFFDVAPAYGDGRAERVLGEALAGRRDDVVVATKIALVDFAFRDLRSYVRASLEASLERLQISAVDVLFLHNPVASVRGRPVQRPGDIEFVTAPDALAAGAELELLRAEGLVRFLGFTGWRCTRAGLLELFGSGLFDVVQIEYNLLNPTAAVAPARSADVTPVERLEADPEVDMARWAYRPLNQHLALELAAEHDVGVACIRPLAGGLLAAELDRPDEPGTDMELLHRAAPSRGPAPERAALAFCLAHPAVSTVIVGAKTAREVEGAVDAASGVP